MEKTALLSYLANSEVDEVYEILRSFLRKFSIFSASKSTETRLCVISALAGIATPDAMDILREGTKAFNRAVRHACQLQLKDIALRVESRKKDIPEQEV